MAPLSMM